MIIVKSAFGTTFSHECTTTTITAVAATTTTREKSTNNDKLKPRLLSGISQCSKLFHSSDCSLLSSIIVIIIIFYNLLFLLFVYCLLFIVASPRNVASSLHFAFSYGQIHFAVTFPSWKSSKLASCGLYIVERIKCGTSLMCVHSSPMKLGYSYAV